MGSNADFARLGDMELDTIPALWEFAQAGRETSAEASLIVLQAAQDLKQACLMIPTLDGRPHAKANRVTRPLRRASLHLYAVQRCFAVTPKVFLKTYEQEINAARNPGRRAGIDLRGR